MSKEEKHAIIGSAVEERAEAKRTLAALQRKLDGYSRDLKTVSEEIPWLGLPGNRTNHTPDDFRKAFERYPTWDQIEEAMKEAQTHKARIEELTRSLTAMGAD